MTDIENVEVAHRKRIKALKTKNRIKAVALTQENYDALNATMRRSRHSASSLINLAINFAVTKGVFDGVDIYVPASIQKARAALAAWESGKTKVKKPQALAASQMIPSQVKRGRKKKTETDVSNQ